MRKIYLEQPRIIAFIERVQYNLDTVTKPMLRNMQTMKKMDAEISKSEIAPRHYLFDYTAAEIDDMVSNGIKQIADGIIDYHPGPLHRNDPFKKLLKLDVVTDQKIRKVLRDIVTSRLKSEKRKPERIQGEPDWAYAWVMVERLEYILDNPNAPLTFSHLGGHQRLSRGKKDYPTLRYEASRPLLWAIDNAKEYVEKKYPAPPFAYRTTILHDKLLQSIGITLC